MQITNICKIKFPFGYKFNLIFDEHNHEGLKSELSKILSASRVSENSDGSSLLSSFDVDILSSAWNLWSVEVKENTALFIFRDGRMQNTLTIFSGILVLSTQLLNRNSDILVLSASSLFASLFFMLFFYICRFVCMKRICKRLAQQ